jgi:hypothetical protein
MSKVKKAVLTGAEVVRFGVLDTQVCVPATWTDDEVKYFTDTMNPCGTNRGWGIRKNGDAALQGDLERRPCAKRKGFVHIMLDA